jgi:hypothetical protein
MYSYVQRFITANGWSTG